MVHIDGNRLRLLDIVMARHWRRFVMNVFGFIEKI